VKAIPVVLVLAVAALASACGGDDDERSASPLQTAADIRTGADADGVSTPLTQLNGSGQTGQVTLTPAGGEKTVVVVRIDKTGADETPAALHTGSCAQLGAVAQQLEPPGERPSETTVDQPLQALLDAPHAVTVGNGPDACADVAGPAE
jgi:hypothetical protein